MNPREATPARWGNIDSMDRVWIDPPQDVIEERRHKDLDRWDEVWEGVYHMVPLPTERHQVLVDGLFVIFSVYFRQHGLGVVRTGKEIHDPDSELPSYRIPEWIALRAGRENLLDPNSGGVFEGPDVVLEVRSPGDETDEKVPHYAKVGVGELLIVERDTCEVEVRRLVDDRLANISPGPDGWIECRGLHAEFRTGERDGKPALQIRLTKTGTIEEIRIP